MDIFGKYTLRALSKNKTRTLMTVVGIVLSVAMFTAVTESVASLREFLVESVKWELGGYHVKTSELDASTLEALSAEDGVERTESLGCVGYADIGSENENKPYLYVASMSDGLTELLSVRLNSGRLPENSGEILLPLHLYSNGNVKYAVGDTLTLDIGRRLTDGRSLNQYNPFEESEGLVSDTRRVYTVVGFYERFSTEIEPYSAPGYTALTVGEPTEYAEAFLMLESMGDTYEFSEKNFGTYGDITANTTLIMLCGISRHSTAMSVMLGMAAVLIGLIMFGSVALIYNSFSVSVGERTRQFGILKSVGATRRQIRRTVLYEALILCAVGVPLGIASGCAGLGITFRLLSNAFGSLSGLVLGVDGEVTLRLVISPVSLAAAAAIGVITTVVSAYIPARRAVRITPIEAVRASSDITLKSVRMRSSRIIYKLFGFEGMIAAKSFKRHKKRYRAAILSLFVSIVLFVSASSFCRYLTDSVDTAYGTYGYDIYYSVAPADEPSSEKLYGSLSAVDAVTDSAMMRGYTDYRCISERYCSEEYNAIAADAAESDMLGNYIYFCYVDRDSYNELAEEIGIKNSEKSTGALVFDNEKLMLKNKEGEFVLSDVSTLFEESVGNELTVHRIKEFDGLNYFKIADGVVLYVPDGLSGASPREEVVRLDYTEALEEETYSVAGFLKERPFFLRYDGVTLIFPDDAFEETEEYITRYMAFKSSDHRKSFDGISKILGAAGADRSGLFDYAADTDSERALVTVINVFAYGFIILISLIALTNVFNTVSTNIFMRRRELAMLKSVGMTSGGFNRMMNYECIICGIRGLGLGLPVSVGVTFLIYMIVSNGYATDFYMPWYSIAVSVLSVFAVVFAAMLYSMRKIRAENTVDILRNENI